MIIQWEDFGSPFEGAGERDSLLTPAEQDAVLRYNAVWGEVWAGLPPVLPSLDVLFLDPSWVRLRDAADAAFAVFAVRGRMTAPTPPQ